MKLQVQANNIYKPLVPYMPKNPMVGYGYIPYQITPEITDVDIALFEGTIFPDLTTPYSDYEKREV